MPKASCTVVCQQLLEMLLLCFHRKLYYAHIMLNYVMNFIFDPRAGPNHFLWIGTAWLHVAVYPSTSENLPPCIMQFLDDYNYFGYL